ncbi:MAG: NADH-quinone oxidoreductase subunit C [Acidimicrobiales bacterium]
MSDAPDVAEAEPEAPEPEPEPERLHGALVVHDRGTTVLHCAAGELVALVTALRADGYWQCIDLCAVDYLTHPGRTTLPAGVEPQRFEVVVSLLNHRAGTRVRIRVQVPESEPVVPTLFFLHPGVEAMEREAWDLFGITFEGHPDMTRILLPDEWSGHPLRKDHAIGKIPVQFKGAPS